jgi:Uri superfamily endonuclease
MIGSYVLLIELSEKNYIQIGKLGNIEFPASWYVYVGSAMNTIEKRVNRHFFVQKKFHWHIDYFLKEAVLKEAYYKESSKREECDIAQLFAHSFQSIPSFGSSDCRCKSHLFHGEKVDLKLTINEAGLQIFNTK